MRKIRGYNAYTADELETLRGKMWRQGVDKTFDMMDYKEPYIDIDGLNAMHDYAVEHGYMYIFDSEGVLIAIIYDTDSDDDVIQMIRARNYLEDMYKSIPNDSCVYTYECELRYNACKDMVENIFERVITLFRNHIIIFPI